MRLDKEGLVFPYFVNTYFYFIEILNFIMHFLLALQLQVLLTSWTRCLLDLSHLNR